jgi:hypothetical protein
MKNLIAVMISLICLNAFAAGEKNHLKIQPSNAVKERYFLITKDHHQQYRFYRCFDTNYDYLADHCKAIMPNAYSEAEIKKEIRYLKTRVGRDLLLSLGTLTIANRLNPNIDPGRFLSKVLIFQKILKSNNVVTYQDLNFDVASDDDLEAMMSEVLAGIK